MAEVSAAPPLPRPFASTPPVPLPSPPPSRGCHPLRPSAGRPASGGSRAVSAGPPLPSMAAVGGEPPVVAPPLVLARDPPPSQAALLPWMHPADPRAILHVLRSDGEPVSVFEFPRKWVGLACAGAAACRRSLSPILLFVHLLFVAMLVLRAAILCFRIAWLLFFLRARAPPVISSAGCLVHAAYEGAPVALCLFFRGRAPGARIVAGLPFWRGCTRFFAAGQPRIPCPVVQRADRWIVFTTWVAPLVMCFWLTPLARRPRHAPTPTLRRCSPPPINPLCLFSFFFALCLGLALAAMSPVSPSLAATRPSATSLSATRRSAGSTRTCAGTGASATPSPLRPRPARRSMGSSSRMGSSARSKSGTRSCAARAPARTSSR